MFGSGLSCTFLKIRARGFLLEILSHTESSRLPTTRKERQFGNQGLVGLSPGSTNFVGKTLGSTTINGHKILHWLGFTNVFKTMDHAWCIIVYWLSYRYYILGIMKSLAFLWTL